MNSLGPNLWISHDWEYRCASAGHRYLQIKVGAWIKKTVSIWCDHHLPHAGRHISFVKIVACGMLSHFSSIAVRSCWILVGTGTRCRTWRSRANQTCSMGDMSGEYEGLGRTETFSASRNCVQFLQKWGRAWSYWNTRWRMWMNGTTMDLRISSRSLCAFKLPSIKCNCVRRLCIPIP